VEIVTEEEGWEVLFLWARRAWIVTLRTARVLHYTTTCDFCQ
jgi:hypothetical protein